MNANYNLVWVEEAATGAVQFISVGEFVREISGN